jgi:hypothetical protein
MYCLASTKVQLATLLGISISSVDAFSYKSYTLSLGTIQHKGGLHFNIYPLEGKEREFIYYLSEYGRIYTPKEKQKKEQKEKETNLKALHLGKLSI